MWIYAAEATCALLFECLGNPTHSCRRGLLQECNYRSCVERISFASRMISYRPASPGLPLSSNNRDDPRIPYKWASQMLKSAPRIQSKGLDSFTR
ncbi:hypothetical protein EV421DRAFT_545025 [Armillaria borealis]|uniref:Uncharacterized protein n=1 Tax=Armillaria borealis TaxID=47425 RepID=A0AA39MDJ8_9AGAR|nr:hypothetical protein EV421DRAFT_545025 [Armillaria borealis]